MGAKCNMGALLPLIMYESIVIQRYYIGYGGDCRVDLMY